MHECEHFLLQLVSTSIAHLTMALAFARIALKAAVARMDFCLALLLDFKILSPRLAKLGRRQLFLALRLHAPDI